MRKVTVKRKSFNEGTTNQIGKSNVLPHLLIGLLRHSNKSTCIGLHHLGSDRKNNAQNTTKRTRSGHSSQCGLVVWTRLGSQPFPVQTATHAGVGGEVSWCLDFIGYQTERSITCWSRFYCSIFIVLWQVSSDVCIAVTQNAFHKFEHDFEFSRRRSILLGHSSSDHQFFISTFTEPFLRNST